MEVFLGKQLLPTTVQPNLSFANLGWPCAGVRRAEGGSAAGAVWEETNGGRGSARWQMGCDGTEPGLISERTSKLHHGRTVYVELMLRPAQYVPSDGVAVVDSTEDFRNSHRWCYRGTALTVSPSVNSQDGP